MNQASEYSIKRSIGGVVRKVAPRRRRHVFGTIAIAVVGLAQMVLISGLLEAQPRLGGALIDGAVVRARGCGSYFFVVYHDEFSLAEWLGGEMVKESDVLQTTDAQSSFEHEGRMSLKNLVTGRTIDVVIEKALMNTADYESTVARVCR